MATSSLYHTQGIAGFNYEKTERTADTGIHHLRSLAKQQLCPQCRSLEHLAGGYWQEPQ